MYNLKYLYDLSRPYYSRMSSINFLVDKELIVESYDNATVLPPIWEKGLLIGKGGVVDQHGKYVINSAQLADGMMNRVNGQYKFDDFSYIDEEVVYLNCFIKQWGHFLIDVIGRMWYLVDNDNYKIAYTSNKGEICGNYLELLNMLGVSENQLIYIEKPTKFRRVIIPESSIYPARYYTKEWKLIFDKLISSATQKDYKSNELPSKVYCSRSCFMEKNEFGEDAIEKVFNINGYTSISMEKLSVRDQIRVINNADSIAMLSGSLMHNLIFAKPGVEAIVLNKSYLQNNHQFLINQASDINFIPIDVWCSSLPIITNGPFQFVISKEFQEYCKTKNYKIVKPNKPYINKIKFLLVYLKVNYKIILRKQIFSETPYKWRDIISTARKVRSSLYEAR